MSNLPKSTTAGVATLPLSIQLPDVSGYTSKVFELKTNPHWHEAEAKSNARFDSYGTLFLPCLVHGVKMTRIYKGLFSGAKRQKFFGSGFGLMTALCYPGADLERLGATMDFVLWLFSVSTIRAFVTPEHILTSSFSSTIWLMRASFERMSRVSSRLSIP